MGKGTVEPFLGFIRSFLPAEITNKCVIKSLLNGRWKFLERFSGECVVCSFTHVNTLLYCRFPQRNKWSTLKLSLTVCFASGYRSWLLCPLYFYPHYCLQSKTGSWRVIYCKWFQVQSHWNLVWIWNKPSSFARWNYFIRRCKYCMFLFQQSSKINVNKLSLAC